jgi:hypothetical protein
MTTLKTSTMLTPAGVTPMPADMLEITAADAGLGVSVHADDFLTPMLKVCQGLSPQLDVNDPGHIPGLKPGDLFIASLGLVYESASAIFATQCRVWIEWLPNRAGFVARHDDCPSDVTPRKNENGSRWPILTRPNNNIIVETREVYLLVNGTPAMLSCSGSFHKFAKGLQSQFASHAHPKTQRPVPCFARKYTLTAVQTVGALGRWYTPITRDSTWVSRAEYDAGKAFHELVSSGRARLAPDTDTVS